jgi:hypothetical protein
MAFTQTFTVTSPLATGKLVADAQWLLSGNNPWKTKFYTGKIDSQYGPLTAAAAHRAKYWLGYPKPDSNFGPLLYNFLTGQKSLPVAYSLRRKLRLSAATRAAATQTKGQKALAYAKTFLNYRETPNNLTIFGKWYGMDGNPWCAMFCSYVAHEVGSKFHYSYVPNVVADARSSRNGLFVTTQPKAGDFVCFDWDNNGEFDHIGIFDHWTDVNAGKFQTCEGNTLPPGGSGNQSNGGGVYAPVRGWKDGYRVVFVRWS